MTRKMLRKLREKGASAIEYGLIAALVAAVLVSIITITGVNLSTVYCGVAGRVGMAGGVANECNDIGGSGVDDPGNGNPTGNPTGDPTTTPDPNVGGDPGPTGALRGTAICSSTTNGAIESVTYYWRYYDDGEKITGVNGSVWYDYDAGTVTAWANQTTDSPYDEGWETRSTARFTPEYGTNLPVSYSSAVADGTSVYYGQGVGECTTNGYPPICQPIGYYKIAILESIKSPTIFDPYGSPVGTVMDAYYPWYADVDFWTYNITANTDPTMWKIIGYRWVAAGASGTADAPTVQTYGGRPYYGWIGGMKKHTLWSGAQVAVSGVTDIDPGGVRAWCDNRIANA